VVVMGGSQPEGYLLDQGTFWPGALQHLLRAPERLARLGAARVHVGSIARSGVDSEALDLIADRVLTRYPHVSAIVVLVGASDVLRWLEQGAPAAAPKAAPASDVFTWQPQVRFGLRPKDLALFEAVRRARSFWLRPQEVHHQAGSWVGKARAMRAQAKVIRTTMPEAEAMLDRFEHHLGRVVEKARARADRVIVVRQPWFDRRCTPEESAQMWHGGVGRAWQDDVATYFSDDVVCRLMAMLDARAARVARECEVEELDLRPLLEPTLENYYDFFHVTPVGARRVADAVARVLLEEPALAAGAPHLEAPKRAS
jgi:hypothetical protein